MKFSVLLAAVLLAATSTTADAKKTKAKKPCDGPENCTEKCSDGVYETWQRKNETGLIGFDRYRCNGTHSDYRWAAFVCTQTVGLGNLLTRRYCPYIDGKICYIDENHPVKCVADPKWLETFKILCATNARSDAWSAKIDDPEILNRCPHEQELYH